MRIPVDRSRVTNPEVLIDNRCAYRIGCPMLQSLPLETISYRYFRGGFEEAGKIRDILNDEVVDVQDLDSVRRKRAHEAASDVGISILIVSDATRSGQLDAWRRSAVRIRRHLLGIRKEIAVEFIDAAAVDGYNTRVVTEDDVDVINAWRLSQAKVLEVLQPKDWQSIDIVWQHFGNGSIRFPTIIVLAPDVDEPSWSHTKQHLEEELGGPFKIEIRCLDRCSLTLADPPGTDNEGVHSNVATWEDIWDDPESHRPMNNGHDINVDNSEYLAIPTGASIGVRGNPHGGTLGMRVKLEVQEEVSYCAITNHHVLARRQLEDSDPHEPIRPNCLLLQEGDVLIVSPSDCDHERTIDAHKVSLEDVEIMALGHSK